MAKAKCLIPECVRHSGYDREANSSGSRGLCAACYRALYTRVSRGETTWAVIESVGLASPAVDWPGVPGRWSKLEAFRNAKELDRAFRGCAAFDSDIP